MNYYTIHSTQKVVSSAQWFSSLYSGSRVMLLLVQSYTLKATFCIEGWDRRNANWRPT
jgi:hypothetical protein